MRSSPMFEPTTEGEGRGGGEWQALPNTYLGSRWLNSSLRFPCRDARWFVDALWSEMLGASSAVKRGLVGSGKEIH